MAGWADGDPLGLRIRAAFGADLTADPGTWSWTDLTGYWHASAPIDLEWGRQPGADRPEPSTCALTLKNTDGRFTAGNALSPYWPHVRKWAVPLEVDVDLGDGAGWRNKHSGTIRSWPVTWPGRSGKMALARIESVGILGRQGRGSPPARSPMRRTIAATGPLAYWPAEDGDAAGAAGSAVPGVDALGIAGSPPFVQADDVQWPVFANFGEKPGTAAVCDLSDGGVLSGRVPAAVTAATVAAWTVTVSAQIPTYTDLSADFVLAEIETPGGTYVRWRVVYSASSATQSVIAYTASGSATTVITGPLAVSAGVWFYHNLSVFQDGPNVRAGYRWSAFSGTWTYTGSVAGTLAGVTQIVVNPTQTTSGDTTLPVGHIALWDSSPMPVPQGGFDTYGELRDGPLLSWNNEAAHLRLQRLAEEDGVTIAVPAISDPNLVIRMGSQPVASRLDLYAEVERTDLGLIYETGHGLAYLPRPDRYNAAVALTIDAAARQLGGDLNPVDDDQRYRDRWTVSREGGSSAVAGTGDVEGSTQVSLAADDTLPYHAGWRYYLATNPNPRVPQISVPLHTQAGRSLAADWMACRPGSRVQVVNAPSAGPSGTIDQVIVGARETIEDRRKWTAYLASEPADRWDVAVADGTQRVGADGSTLAAELTSSATSLYLSSTEENGPWTEDPAHVPMDLRVGGYQGTGGERATASAIGPSVSDSYDRTTVGGFGTAPTGQPYITSGGSSGDYNTAAGVATIDNPSVNVLRYAYVTQPWRDLDVTADLSWNVNNAASAGLTAWLFGGDDLSNYTVARLDLSTSGVVSLVLLTRDGGVLGVLASGAAGPNTAGQIWRTRLWRTGEQVNGTAVNLSTGASVLVTAGNPDPGLSDGGSIIGVAARREAGNTNTAPVLSIHALTVSVPQLVTLSARGVNGVQRAWAAGTEVDVWDRGIVAL